MNQTNFSLERSLFKLQKEISKYLGLQWIFWSVDFSKSIFEEPKHLKTLFCIIQIVTSLAQMLSSKYQKGLINALFPFWYV